MKVLATRKILLSKPGVGTFVGPEIGDARLTRRRVVHLVMSAEGLCDLPLQEIVSALVQSIDDCDVQLNFLPSENQNAYIRNALMGNRNSDAPLGVVLASCPRLVQEEVVKFNLPTVVLGSSYPTTQHLASIDVDQFEAGRLLASHLCNSNHRKLAFITHELWLPGDNKFFDGVRDALGQAGLGHDALILRSISTDASVVDSELRGLLDAQDRPTGVVCRSSFFAAAASRVASKMNLKVPSDLEIVYDGTVGLLSAPHEALPHVQADIDHKEICRKLGHTLRLLIDGKPAENRRIAASVRLKVPATHLQKHNESIGT